MTLSERDPHLLWKCFLVEVHQGDLDGKGTLVNFLGGVKKYEEYFMKASSEYQRERVRQHELAKINERLENK